MGGWVFGWGGNLHDSACRSRRPCDLVCPCGGTVMGWFSVPLHVADWHQLFVVTLFFRCCSTTVVRPTKRWLGLLDLLYLATDWCACFGGHGCTKSSARDFPHLHILRGVYLYRRVTRKRHTIQRCKCDTLFVFYVFTLAPSLLAECDHTTVHNMIVGLCIVGCSS